MKARTTKDAYGDGAMAGIKCMTYGIVLALNDLYGWKDAGRNVAVATAEIVNGYFVDYGGDAVEQMVKELDERGIHDFVVDYKKGGRTR